MPFAKWIPVAILISLATSCNLASAASLDVDVTHLRPTRTVTVRVYKDAESWSRADSPVASAEFKAVETRQTLRIDNLPPGRYAVRVDQEPNSSSLEMPNFSLERHGYSGNDSRNRPVFERAAIEVGEGGAKIPVHLFVGEHH